MKIGTTYVYPPIPDRRWDWSAIDEDTYDGAPDSHCPIGQGATEAEAIADLLAQIEDAAAPTDFPGFNANQIRAGLTTPACEEKK